MLLFIISLLKIQPFPRRRKDSAVLRACPSAGGHRRALQCSSSTETLGQTGSRAGCCGVHIISWRSSLHSSALGTRSTHFFHQSTVFNSDILDYSKCFAAPQQNFPSPLPRLFSRVLLPLLWSPVLCLLSQKDHQVPLEHFRGLLFPLTVSASRALEMFWENTRHFHSSCRNLISPFPSNSTGFPFLGFFFPHTLKGSDSVLHCSLSSGQPSWLIYALLFVVMS